jgi:hypothetical protein
VGGYHKFSLLREESRARLVNILLMYMQRLPVQAGHMTGGWLPFAVVKVDEESWYMNLEFDSPLAPLCNDKSL